MVPIRKLLAHTIQMHGRCIRHVVINHKLILHFQYHLYTLFVFRKWNGLSIKWWLSPITWDGMSVNYDRYVLRITHSNGVSILHLWLNILALYTCADAKHKCPIESQELCLNHILCDARRQAVYTLTIKGKTHAILHMFTPLGLHLNWGRHSEWWFCLAFASEALPASNLPSSRGLLPRTGTTHTSRFHAAEDSMRQSGIELCSPAQYMRDGRYLNPRFYPLDNLTIFNFTVLQKMSHRFIASHESISNECVVNESRNSTCYLTGAFSASHHVGLLHNTT